MNDNYAMMHKSKVLSMCEISLVGLEAAVSTEWDRLITIVKIYLPEKNYDYLKNRFTLDMSNQLDYQFLEKFSLNCSYQGAFKRYIKAVNNFNVISSLRVLAKNSFQTVAVNSYTLQLLLKD